MLDLMERTFIESWLVLGQMSPYLLLGFLVAGVLSVWIRPEWVERHLGRPGLGPVLTASLVGVPLPLCSCGVIPVAASIRRHGASRGATAAFLLSTPQTGVDSIAVTYALLGPVFAVFRPLAALVSGIVGGFLVQLFDKPQDTASSVGPSEPTHCDEPCCEEETKRGPLTQAMHYGFVTLPRDIGLPLLVGVLIAGLMATLVPEDRLHQYVGGGVVAILLMMAVGVPVYVCATASVPIAAGFLHVGASPGAALAFLIAGPATNAATLTTIWKVLGPRSTVLYGATVAASAVGFGLLLDWLIPTVAVGLPQVGDHVHASVASGWFGTVWAVLLLGTLAFSWLATSRWARGRDADAASGSPPGKPSEEQRLEFSIEGMRCSHCVDSVRRSLAESAGVRQVEVDLGRARALVRGRNLDPDELGTAVTQLGYKIHPVQSSQDE